VSLLLLLEAEEEAMRTAEDVGEAFVDDDSIEPEVWSLPPLLLIEKKPRTRLRIDGVRLNLRSSAIVDFPNASSCLL